MGVVAWSPLGAGFLTGKYNLKADGAVATAGGRLDSDNQPFRMFKERKWKILTDCELGLKVSRRLAVLLEIFRRVVQGKTVFLQSV